MSTVFGFRRICLFVVLTIILCVSWIPISRADEIEEWIVESRLDRYYDLPKTARVVGMGGASLVTSSDISSVFGNPAGLGFVVGPEVGITYSHDEFSGTDFSYEPFNYQDPDKAAGDPIYRGSKARKNMGGLQLVLPCYSRGVFGFGLWVDDADYSDIEDTDARRYILNAGYGYKVNDCLSIGYSLNYFNDDLDDDWGDYELEDGFRHNFGLQLRPCQGMTFGASTYFAHGNPETSISHFGSDEDDLDAWGVEFGYSWQVLPCTLLAASVDYQDRDGSGMIYAPNQDEVQRFNEDIKGWGFHVGMEQNYRDCLFPRLGYRYQTNDYDYSQYGEYFRDNGSFDANYHAVSWGLGWAYNCNLSLDYAMEYRFIGDGDINNTVTARFHF